MSGDQENEHRPSRSPPPASPFASSSSSTDFVPFLSDSEGPRSGGGPLPYADGPIIMLSLPDDCPSPPFGSSPADSVEPDLAQYLFGEMPQREATITDRSVESARPSTGVLSSGAAASEFVGADANPVMNHEITVKCEPDHSKKSHLPAQKKSRLNSSCEVAAAGSPIDPVFHLEPGKEATEQLTLQVSGTYQSVIPPMLADDAVDHVLSRSKSLVSRRRRRGAQIRSPSSSPEPSPQVTVKAKGLASCEANDEEDDSSRNSREDITIKRVVKEDPKNKGSLESFNCQEGDEYPRKVLDALHLICRGREPDRRFEAVDILEVAMMKGLGISMTPKWWRPGGYDAPMPKNCKEGA